MSKGKLADKAGCGTDRPLATAGKALRAGGPGRRRQGPTTHHDRASGNSRSALRGSERLEPARPPPPAASLGLRRCHPPRPTPPPTFTSDPSGTPPPQTPRPPRANNGPATGQLPTVTEGRAYWTAAGQCRTPIGRQRCRSLWPTSSPPLAHGDQEAWSVRSPTLSLQKAEASVDSGTD